MSTLLACGVICSTRQACGILCGDAALGGVATDLLCLVDQPLVAALPGLLLHV